MAFLDSPRFPENLSYGAVCGPAFQTDAVIVQSGFESRNVNWQQARARYEVGHRGRTRAETDALIAFFRAVKGRAHGFRFKDWTDYQVSHANGRLARLPGQKFQLQKLYSSGALNELRNIRKPVSASILRNDTPIILGKSPGQGSLDMSTGVLSLVPDISRIIATISQANPGIVTTSTPHNFVTGDVTDLWLPASMSELHLATSIIKVLSPTTFSIGVDTTRMSPYIGAGEARKTVQATETLSWQGEFDVPCRFDTDQMQIEIVDKQVYSWGQIPIVEIRT